MRLLPVICVLFLGMLASCSKDSASTKPSLEFKTMSTSFVPFNSDLYMELNFKDKEGDLDSIFVKRIRINQHVVAETSGDFKFNVPANDKTKDGLLELAFTYTNYLQAAINPPVTGNPPVTEPDSLVFKMWLKDKASNISDTLITPLVVIERR